jgi:hypothetical protein
MLVSMPAIFVAAVGDRGYSLVDRGFSTPI